MILTLGSKKLIFSPNLRHFIKGMNCNYHNSQEKKVKKDGCKPKLMKQMQWAEYMYVCLWVCEYIFCFLLQGD